MHATFTDGHAATINPAGHVIVPTGKRPFDIEDDQSWESDRATFFARVGATLWIDGELRTVATIS